MSEKVTPDYETHKEELRHRTKYPEKPLNKRLQAIVSAIPAQSKVLDVACGTGRVLHAAIDKGCRGRGIEITPGGALAAQQKGLDVLEGDVDTFDENAEVHELMFAEYDIAIFSKCLMYLKTKNQIIDQLNVDTIIVFQKCPSYWKFRLNNERAKWLEYDKEKPYRLKGGEIIAIDSPKAVARWGASYGYAYSKCLRGGFWHGSMIIKMSRIRF